MKKRESREETPAQRGRAKGAGPHTSRDRGFLGVGESRSVDVATSGGARSGGGQSVGLRTVTVRSGAGSPGAAAAFGQRRREFEDQHRIALTTARASSAMGYCASRTRGRESELRVGSGADTFRVSSHVKSSNDGSPFGSRLLAAPTSRNSTHNFRDVESGREASVSGRASPAQRLLGSRIVTDSSHSLYLEKDCHGELQTSPVMKESLERMQIQGGTIPSRHAKSLLRALSMAREYEAWEAAQLANSAPARPTPSPTKRATATWMGGKGEDDDDLLVNNRSACNEVQLFADVRAAQDSEAICRRNEKVRRERNQAPRASPTPNRASPKPSPSRTTNSLAISRRGTPSPVPPPPTYEENELTPRDGVHGSPNCTSSLVVVEGAAQECEYAADVAAFVPDIAVDFAAFELPPMDDGLSGIVFPSKTQRMTRAGDDASPCGCYRKQNMKNTECNTALEAVRWLQREVEQVLYTAKESGLLDAGMDSLPSFVKRDLLLAQTQICTSIVHALANQAAVSGCIGQARLVAFLWNQQIAQLNGAVSELADLHEEVGSLDEMRAELQAAYIPVETYNELLEQHKELQEKHEVTQSVLQGQNHTLGRAEAELEELRRYQDTHGDKAHAAEVAGLKRQMAVLEKDKEFLQGEVDRANQKAVSMKSEADAVKSAWNNAEERMHRMQSDMKRMSPRLKRRFVYPSERLSEPQVQELEQALEEGVPHPTLVCLMQSGHLKPYLKHLGVLADQQDFPFTRADFFRMLQTDTKPLLDVLNKKSLTAMQHCLHHGVSADNTATILLAETSDGYDARPLKNLIGALAGVDSSHIANMLKVASLTNKDRFLELERDKEVLKSTIDDLRKRMDIMQTKAEGKNKRVQDKVNRHMKTRKKSAMERFLETDWSDKDSFVGLGTAGDVPVFLHAEGRIFNEHWTKLTTEKIVKKIWNAKIQHDDRLPGGCPSVMTTFLSQYIAQHLERQHRDSGPENVALFGYNLLHALHRWMYDADCQLFLQVLLGEVSENVHYQQLQMQTDVLETLAKVDATKHGEARGSLTKGQVMKCIKEMMPSKTSEQLRELEKAMDEQFPGYTLVEYKKLFDEDTNCDQGSFAECLRDQSLYERFEYLQELQNALFNQSYEDDRVDPGRATIAFKQVDPDISEANLKIYIERLFGMQKPSPTQTVGVVEGLGRIKRGVIESKNVENSNAGRRGSLFGTKASTSTNNMKVPPALDKMPEAIQDTAGDVQAGAVQNRPSSVEEQKLSDARIAILNQGVADSETCVIRERDDARSSIVQENKLDDARKAILNTVC